MSDIYQAMELTVRLRSDFKSLADLFGPERAFVKMASALIEPIKGDPTKEDEEERRVRLVRALYDDYVGAKT